MNGSRDSRKGARAAGLRVDRSHAPIGTGYALGCAINTKATATAIGRRELQVQFGKEALLTRTLEKTPRSARGLFPWGNFRRGRREAVFWLCVARPLHLKIRHRSRAQEAVPVARCGLRSTGSRPDVPL